jgi:NAD(P)-dependent dehydrogenase (short-subunit alcohol dehydrogenase family)
MKLSGKNILVTGASTGIGEACARSFAGSGARVYAGVRREADAERLADLVPDRLVPVLLDVTDEQQIAETVERIDHECGMAGLHGLVNNAGVARGGPLEYLEVDEWRDQFEVNVFGQVAVTRAALPLIRRAPGRIVFVGSISGRVATPFMGPYAASKHAIEAIGESLRHELAPWEIHVSVVEPGVIATAIWGKGTETLQRLTAALPPQAHERYGEVFAQFEEAIRDNATKGISPRVVADAVEHALVHPHPRPRYLVGRDAQIAAVADRILPDRLMERLVRSQRT